MSATSDVTIIESKIVLAMLSDLMKRLFHLAWPSSTAIVGAHVYRHADGRLLSVFVYSRPSVECMREGRAVVTGACWHLIMMVIVSSWQHHSVFLSDTPIKEWRLESSLGRPSLKTINACYEAASIAYSKVISLVITTHLQLCVLREQKQA